MKRGDIYLFDLSNSTQHEQSGTRPGILATNLVNGMLLVLPLTTNLESLRFSHTLSIVPDGKNNLKSESVALVFHLKSLDRRRAIKFIGKIDAPVQKELNLAMRNLLSLE